MDLIGPMHVEILAEKRYTFVCVSDFSRYTWVDEFWVKAMQNELEKFERNGVWILVPRPSDINVLGTKWNFKNKTDEFGNIVRNKAKLVAQGHTQIEGVNFDETFALVARLESIHLLFAVACLIGFKLFQMDVKSAFLMAS